MTAYEMVLKVLARLGEDVTDTSVITEYKADILDALNLADGEMCSRALHPMLWAQIALDASKEYDLSGLDHDVVKVNKVTLTKDSDVTPYEWHDVGDNHIAAPDATAGGMMWIHYEAAPTPMTADNSADTSAPEFTPARYHDAYIFKALAEIFAGEKRKDVASSILYENKYEDRLSQVRPLKRQTVITNTNSY